MEAEEGEAIKGYNNTPQSFDNILLAVAVTVVALVGYWCFPTVVSSPQVVTAWFDWFRLVIRNIFYVFVFVNALILVLVYVSFRKTGEKHKPDLYDQYLAASPSVVRALPEYNNYRVTEVEDDGYFNKSDYKTVKECNCYDGVVMEQEVLKSYRRTRSEKKKKTRTVEYRRTESERVSKTASWRSQSQSQTMDVLSSEEFRMTVETFIMEKKKTLHREYDVVDRWRTGFPQPQNGVVHWENGVVQCQGLPDDRTGRNRRLVGGSGSIGSGPYYLAISNQTGLHM